MAKKLYPAARRDRANLWISLALLAAVFVVYAQAHAFSFVNYDDPDYVKPRSVASAFTSTEAANWFPVTRLSHLLDRALFDEEAGMHHLVNVAIHSAASVLLFLFLVGATGCRWPSAFVAFIFALHPLHVESVAWVAERKDVLCAFFWFLALWAYVRNNRILVIIAFILGLMSKPMIVTLPFTLMLLDLWPLKRGLRWRDKLPLFAITAAGAVVTYAVQYAGGAVKPVGAPAISNALVSYVVYLSKTLWPADLTVFYPYPAGIPFWQAAGAAAILAAITFAVVRAWSARPYLAIGWFWFLGTLIPVIGLVQVGAQARADRYMYVPMVGLAIMAAWGIADLLRARPRLGAALGVAACFACGAAAYSQTGYWENSGTLFAHAIEATRDNYIAEHNLGAYLMDQPGQIDEAISHLREAVRLRPESGQSHSDLGTALAKLGRIPEALPEFQAAARLLPDNAIPHNNLANALADSGRLPEAMAEYQTALRLNPEYTAAKNNLARIEAALHYRAGIELAKQGKLREAVPQLEESLRLNPGNPEAHNNLGVILQQIGGRQADAIAHFREALRLNPDYADARYNLELATRH
jgi:tetratricopeptide (TPR) repeat protein